MALRRMVLAASMVACVMPVRAGTLTGRAGPFALEVAVHPDPPVIGENHVTVIVRHGDGRVPNATVQLEAQAEGGEPIAATASASGEPGEYLGALTLPSRGRYALKVVVSAGQGEKPTTGAKTFTFSTGNPVWQADPGQVRTFWFGLALLALALVIVQFLPLWPNHHDRKAILAAAILLVGAWLLARHAVKTWRRPGQMDVIEAQAMDMTAMKPPIGVVPVQVEQVAYGDFDSTVTYTGSVVPYNEQAVKARVTGWIVDMPVYPGDSVTRGSILAQLDRNELSDKARQAIEERQTAADSAAAARSEATQQRRKIDELRAQADAAQAMIRQARSMRDEAAAALNRARSDRDRAVASVTEAERQVAAAKAGRRSAEAIREVAESEVNLAGAQHDQANAMVDQAEQGLEAAKRQVGRAQSELTAQRAAVEQAEAELRSTKQILPQAESDVAAAQADVDYWKPEMVRMKALLDQGAVSREEFDREQAQAENAAAKLKRAQSKVTEARSGIAASEAALKQAKAGVSAAQETVAARQAEAKAAESKVAEAQANVEVHHAHISMQGSDVDSKAAQVDEAGETIGMRQAQLARAKAGVTAADAAIQEAERRLSSREAAIQQAKAEALAAERAIPTGLAQAQAASQRATAATQDIAAKQAAVATQETILGYTTIRSELDGVVTERATAPPTLVQPGDLLLRVAQIDRVRLQANVATEDARQILEGARVKVTTPKAGDRVDDAVVTSVFPAADPASRTSVVEAVLENADRFYLPGDPITMQIATGAVVEVITVPQESVAQRVAQPGEVTGEVRPVVWTVRGGSGGGQTEYYCTMHPQIVEDHPGLCPICKMDLVPRQVAGGGDRAGSGEVEQEWYCTMHPQIVQDHPGTCPICKMDLVPRTIGGAGGQIAHQVAVNLGQTGNGRVEVLEGLKPGDRVVVKGFENLHEGDRVNVVDALNLEVPPVGSVSQVEGGGMADMPGMDHGGH